MLNFVVEHGYLSCLLRFYFVRKSPNTKNKLICTPSMVLY